MKKRFLKKREALNEGYVQGLRKAQSIIEKMLMESIIDVKKMLYDGFFRELRKIGDNIESYQIILGQLKSDEQYDTHGQSLLHAAAFVNHPNAVEYLLERGISVDLKTPDGRTPLHDAAYGGSLECARILIDNGAKVDAVDAEGKTPLHQAVAGNFPEFCNFLIENGADVNKVDKGSKTPLRIAKEYECKEAERVLRKHGAILRRIPTTKF